jgi:hypothetical protein
VEPDGAAHLDGPALDCLARALADLAPVEVDPRHPGGGGEGDELAARPQVALADAEALLGQHDDRAALGGLVRQRSQLRRLGHLLLGVARRRDELRSHAVAEGDGPGLVEEQGLDVPGRLDGTAAHGEHVPLHEAVHTGDPDGR